MVLVRHYHAAMNAIPKPKGAGGKPQLDGDPTQQGRSPVKTFQVPPEMAEQVEAAAAEHDGLSALVRQALTEYLSEDRALTSTGVRTLWSAMADQDGFITGGQARTLGVDTELQQLFNAGLIDKFEDLAGDVDVFIAPDNHGNYWEAYTVPWLLLKPDVLAVNRGPFSGPVDAALTGESALRMYKAGTLSGGKAEFIVSEEEMLARAEQIPSTTAVLGSVGPRQFHLVRGIPVLAPHLVIGQLAKEGYDGDHIGDSIADLLVRADTSIEMIAPELEPYAKYYGYHSGTEMAVMLAVFSGGVLDQAKTIVEIADQWVV